MSFPKVLVCLSLAVVSCLGQQDYDYSSGSGYQKPPPAIIMHKQGLTQDGHFNYVFASENGLKQGETISPDGTRTGGYSYVDPNGKTITVKYQAGKDGFKILEGDHIPKAPQLPAGHQQPRYNPQPQQYYQPQQQQYNNDYDDGSYPSRGQAQVRAKIIQHFPSPQAHHKAAGSAQVYRVQEDSAPRSASPAANNYNYREESEHKGPHNWGPGYSFEFAG